MKPTLEFQLLLKHFSDNLKFTVFDLFIDNCKIIMYVKITKQKPKKNNFSIFENELTLVSNKLKIFTGFEILLVTEFNTFISLVGHSVFIGCDNKFKYHLPSPKRRRFK